MTYGRKTVTYGNSGVVYAVMIGYSTYYKACRFKRMRTVASETTISTTEV